MDRRRTGCVRLGFPSTEKVGSWYRKRSSAVHRSSGLIPDAMSTSKRSNMSVVCVTRLRSKPGVPLRMK
eukprot:IDg16629t1